MDTLKYTKEEYESSGFYDVDMDVEMTNQTFKLVKVRKEHLCANCSCTIPSKTFALRESALCRGEGWKSCYTCIKCLDDWLDQIVALSKEDE